MMPRLVFAFFNLFKWKPVVQIHQVSADIYWGMGMSGCPCVRKVCVIFDPPTSSGGKQEDKKPSSVQLTLKSIVSTGRDPGMVFGCFLRVRWLPSGIDREMVLSSVSRCRKGMNPHLFPVDKQEVDHLVKSCYLKESRLGICLHNIGQLQLSCQCSRFLEGRLRLQRNCFARISEERCFSKRFILSFSVLLP